MAPDHLGQEIRVSDDLHNAAAHSAAQRVASVSGAMGACGHAGGGRFGGKHCPQGEAAADALGNHHDVGCDPRPFMGK